MQPVITPDEAANPREISFNPPHKPIIQSNIPVKAAVLKFGCLSINKINNPKVIIERIFLLFLTSFQCAKRFDASKIKNGFINSDGCKRKPPNINHLDDPLTVIPLMFVSNIKNIKK